MELLNFRLTKLQQKYLKAIEWLISPEDNRRSGRTTLMAIAFIKWALTHPERWIDIFDHFPTEEAKERLLIHIKKMISLDEKLLKRSEFRRGMFRINSA
jgi:hypothetical protein